MTKQEAIDYFGGIKELAKELNIWPTAISRWDKYPPKAKQYEIQVRTKGKLKVEKDA